MPETQPSEEGAAETEEAKGGNAATGGTPDSGATPPGAAPEPTQQSEQRPSYTSLSQRAQELRDLDVGAEDQARVQHVLDTTRKRIDQYLRENPQEAARLHRDQKSFVFEQEITPGTQPKIFVAEATQERLAEALDEINANCTSTRDRLVQILATPIPPAAPVQPLPPPQPQSQPAPSPAQEPQKGKRTWKQWWEGSSSRTGKFFGWLDKWTAWLDWRSDKFLLGRIHRWKQ